MSTSVLTNILDLRVLHDELVHRDRGDPEEQPRQDHGDDTRDPSQNSALLSVFEKSHSKEGLNEYSRERPRLGHDGQTDLLTREQASSLLP